MDFVYNIVSLQEYVNGGCEINLILGIDYTGSNGNPTLPTSLHYQSGLQPNSYETAINEVGMILMDYDQDKMIPTFGYGAMLNNSVNHCFALNFNPSNPELNGIPSVLAAYKNSFKYCGLSGPTLFAPLLTMVYNMASRVPASQENQKYYTVLIVTDGAINDMPETIDLLVALSNLPVSVIIVGVGNADFSGIYIHHLCIQTT